MHIGFSFKPKTLLIILVAILGIVGLCVDAFADPLPEDGTAQLLTDETDPTGTTETPASTVVINAAPAAEAAAPETYTYQRGEHTGHGSHGDDPERDVQHRDIDGEYIPCPAQQGLDGKQQTFHRSTTFTRT